MLLAGASFFGGFMVCVDPEWTVTITTASWLQSSCISLFETTGTLPEPVYQALCRDPAVSLKTHPVLTSNHRRWPGTPERSQGAVNTHHWVSTVMHNKDHCLLYPALASWHKTGSTWHADTSQIS